MGPPLKVVRGPQNRPELFFASRMMVNEQTDLVEPALQWMLTGQNKGILGIYKYSPQEVEQFRRLLLSEMDKIPELKGKDHLVGVIHANLSAEQRDAVLARAKQGIIRILIGTVCMGLVCNLNRLSCFYCIISIYYIISQVSCDFFLVFQTLTFIRGSTFQRSAQCFATVWRPWLSCSKKVDEVAETICPHTSCGFMNRAPCGPDTCSRPTASATK